MSLTLIYEFAFVSKPSRQRPRTRVHTFYTRIIFVTAIVRFISKTAVRHIRVRAYTLCLHISFYLENSIYYYR